MSELNFNFLINKFLNKTIEILENAFLDTNKLNKNVSNETVEAEKFKATPEGLFLAYTSLLLMALIPIIIGSFKSVSHQNSQKESGEEVETMSTNEAMLFPVIASFSLFGIYLIFQIFSKDHINLLIAFYFFLLGVIALTRMINSLLENIWPTFLIENENYEINFSLTSPKKELISLKNCFDRKLIFCFIVSLAIGLWYFLKKHWIANNIFGLAFAVNGIEFLQLNKILNGCILLGGLFFYDVFWVFGTNVMVNVAKSFDAPIKLIFPQDLIESGFNAEKFALLGLGDIVIPGIFIALLLRYDYSLKRNKKIYFYSSFIAYVLALICTIFVMHTFKHAQPALLYIVPLCLLTPLTIALIQGDIKSMFSYRDHDEQETVIDKTSEEKKIDILKNTNVESKKKEIKKTK